MYKRYSSSENFNNVKSAAGAAAENPQKSSGSGYFSTNRGSLKNPALTNSRKSSMTDNNSKSLRHMNNNGKNNSLADSAENNRIVTKTNTNANVNASSGIGKGAKYGGGNMLNMKNKPIIGDSRFSNTNVSSGKPNPYANNPAGCSVNYARSSNNPNNKRGSGYNNVSKNEKMNNTENCCEKHNNKSEYKGKANKGCCTDKADCENNNINADLGINKLINSFLNMLPSSVYNKKSKKFFGIIETEDLLLIMLIFLLMENDSNEEPALVYALIYLLVSDYIKEPLI